MTIALTIRRFFLPFASISGVSSIVPNDFPSINASIDQRTNEVNVAMNNPSNSKQAKLKKATNRNSPDEKKPYVIMPDKNLRM